MAEAATSKKNDPAFHMRELFGDHVVKGDMLDEIPIESLVGEGKVVGIYLSGHWCPPCKAFTPVLTAWYEAFKEGPNADKFEIIFVSSDKCEVDFMRYFITMPWTALPYIERDRKANISSLFNVSGIPVLILLNPNNCEIIAEDGRLIVQDDENGEDFPWMPVPINDLISGDEIIKCSDNSMTTFGTNFAGKTFGLFFGAKWCPPCHAFMEKLEGVYKAVNNTVPGDDTKFEIIFASTDTSEEDFNDFYTEMPWYTLPYNDRRRKKLHRMLKIGDTIPSFVVIGKDGRIINDSCITAVENDPEGKKFPWHPKPVMELDDEAVEKINEFPCLVWLTKSDGASLEQARNTLEPVSEAYHKGLPSIEEAKKTKRILQFYYGGATEEDDIGEQLRSFADLPDATPLLTILDVSCQSKFICSKKKLTKQVIGDFVKGFQAGKLPKQPLEL